MSKKVIDLIEIKNCLECRHCESERVYTSDSWEYVQKLTCKKENRVISEYYEWHDKTEIPDWCPLIIV